MSSNQPEGAVRNKLFGRFHEVVLLILGFFLTTVSGAFIADRIQRQTWRRQRDADDLIEEKKRAMALIDELSMQYGVLDTSIFECSYHQDRQGKLKDTKECKRALDEFHKWKAGSLRRTAAVSLLFGADGSSSLSKLEDSLGKSYVALTNLRDNGVMKWLSDYETDSQYEEYDLAAKESGGVAGEFMETLLKAYQNGKVGRFVHPPAPVVSKSSAMEWLCGDVSSPPA